MQSKKNRNKSEIIKRRDATLIGQTLAALRYSQDKRLEMYRLKTTATPSDLFLIAPRVLKGSRFYEIAHGQAFPKEIKDFFGVKPLYMPANFLQEIIWTICRCLSYSKELCDFVTLRRAFERGVITDSKQNCESLICEIEEKFGQSLWSIQSRLSVARHWGGLSDLKNLASRYRTSDGISDITGLLVWFMQRRIEAASDFDFLKGELAKALGEIKNPDIKLYFESKLFDLGDVGVESISSLLFFDAQVSLIDSYESLVHILLSIVSASNLPLNIVKELEGPVASLFMASKDHRLKGVLRSLGCFQFNSDAEMVQRNGIIELHAAGRYEECIKISEEYLLDQPDDMSIFVLQHKAVLRSNGVLSKKDGILREVSDNLISVLRFGDGVYVAAHEIIKLWGRFYGQHWVSYLKAVVRYELRQERIEFPPFRMRAMIARDHGVTPFSAIGIPEYTIQKFFERASFEDLMPFTLNAYRIVTAGKRLDGCEMPPNESGREARSFADHNLLFGDARVAISIYKNLLGSVSEADAARCASGIVLANIRLNNIRIALDELVATFVRHPFVAGVLPIEAAVDELKDPRVWPNCISLPLAFGLHNDCYGSESLARLRYAFERFQLDNKISTPDDILKIDCPNEWKVLYLRSVWRPEVMRQTIIYSSSKEVEEARIKVCQLLARLDHENEEEYLDEIKDRVKRLAVADGLNLVEQSKVYVDVHAIKKEIIKRLESPYRKYKSTQGAALSSDRLIVAAKIAEVLGRNSGGDDPEKIFSNLHLTGWGSSEEDAQIDAMYAEVENEFLRGAHGLNAYLSTRIRHGVLSNLVRKPVEDAGLVTFKEENGERYLRNERWIVWEDESDKSQVTLSSSLEFFSKSFDSVLDDIRDNLLQIRIENTVRSKGRDRDRALFVYSSSSVERLLLQAGDRQGKGLDQFIDRCLEYLWRKTDENLERVQFELNVSTRQRLMVPFDELMRSIGGLPSSAKINDLVNTVARAKTDTQARLSTVVSWFKRSEVYDRQDYAPEFLLEVAHSMIRNTISSAAKWSTLSVFTAEPFELMPGRTFDVLVYVFYGLLENSIKRSKLPVSELSVSVDLSMLDGVFSAIVRNNVDLSKMSTDDRVKIEKAKQSIHSTESIRLAQGEGLSGLNKIWLAVSGPYYSNPSLSFDIEDENFVVRLGFSFGG